jgi:hypothetical protein
MTGSYERGARVVSVGCDPSRDDGGGSGVTSLSSRLNVALQPRLRSLQSAGNASTQVSRYVVTRQRT